MWYGPRAQVGRVEKAPITQPTLTLALRLVWCCCFPSSFMPHKNFWEIHLFIFPLPYKAESKKVFCIARGAALLIFWVCYERPLWQQVANKAAVCSSRPAVPLNWWPFGCFILYEIVSFSFFSLMGDFTTNPIFFFMPYIFSCWIFGLVWKCHIIDNSTQSNRWNKKS